MVDWRQSLRSFEHTAPDLRFAAVVGVWVALLLASVNIRVFHNDNIPNVLLPLSLLREGNLELSEFRAVLDEVPEGERYWAVHGPNGIYSKYPVWTGVIVAPLFAPLAGWTTQLTNDKIWLACGRLVALLFSAVFAGALAATLRRKMPGPWAVGLTLCAVLGSALWHHLGSHLTNQVVPNVCIVLILALLLRGRMTRGMALLAGLLAGLAVASRLPAALAAGLPLGVFLSRRSWRPFLPWVAGGGMIFPLLTGWYNAAAFGHPLRTGYSYYDQDAFTANFFEGAAGLLFSPACGLFVYSPFLLAGVWAGVICLRSPRAPDHDLGIWVLLGVVGQWLLFSRWWCWNGALTFGCRMLVETVPLLTVLLAIGWHRLGSVSRVRRLLIVTGALAVAHHLLGTVAYDATAPDNPLKPDWSWSRDFIVLYWERCSAGQVLFDVLRFGGLFCGMLLIGGYLAGRFFEDAAAGVRRLSGGLVESR